MSNALKFDDGKTPLHLLDAEYLEGVARVLEFGARKYAADNWRKGVQYTRLFSAIQRHLLSFSKGEEVDPETGFSHLLHASCGLMFLYHMQLHRRDLNDMWWAAKPEPKHMVSEDERDSTYYYTSTVAKS